MTPIERKARELLATELDIGELLGARDRVADGEPLTPVEKAAIRALIAALTPPAAQAPEGYRISTSMDGKVSFYFDTTGQADAWHEHLCRTWDEDHG